MCSFFRAAAQIRLRRPSSTPFWFLSRFHDGEQAESFRGTVGAESTCLQ